jgi:hypothetical protein
MSDNRTALDERKSDLLEHLSQTESSTDRQAKKYEGWARNLNIATGIAALPSILAGLIASLVHSHPDPWIFSVLATLASVFAWFHTTMSWRKRSQVFFAHRDQTRKFISRLKFEMPTDITAEQIALIADQFSAMEGDIGKRHTALNEDAEKRWLALSAKGSPKDTTA